MNKAIALLPALLFLFLAACTKYYPQAAFLELTIPSQPSGIYDQSITAALSGTDGRASKELVAYRLEGDPEIRIPSLDPPQEVVVRNLISGFERQGLGFSAAGPVFMTLEIEELVVNVTKSKLLYRAESVSRLQMTIKNGKQTFTKKYAQEAFEESVTRPELDELEKMAAAQLSEIIGKILADREISRVISGR